MTVVSKAQRLHTTGFRVISLQYSLKRIAFTYALGACGECRTEDENREDERSVEQTPKNSSVGGRKGGDIWLLICKLPFLLYLII